MCSAFVEILFKVRSYFVGTCVSSSFAKRLPEYGGVWLHYSLMLEHLSEVKHHTHVRHQIGGDNPYGVPSPYNKCHSCCVWTRVLWQVARQRSDGDRLVAAGLGQLVMGVTFIPLFYGRAPLVVTERAVLALFCTPTS